MQQSQEFNLHYYSDLLLRRRWSIFFVFLSVFSASIYYIYQKPFFYQATATFIIESQTADYDVLENLSLNKVTRSFGFYETLIKSETFIKRIITHVLSDSQLSHERYDKTDITGILKNNLFFRSEDLSELFTLSIQAPDSLLAYFLCSTATNVLIERCRELEQVESRNIISFVVEQKDLAISKLEEAERELQKFKKSTNDTDILQDGGIIKKLTKLENQLSEIQIQRKLAQADLNAFNQRLQHYQEHALSGKSAEPPGAQKLRQELEQLENEKMMLFQNQESKKPLISIMNKKIQAKRNQLITTIIETNKNQQSFGDLELSQWKLAKENQLNAELELYILNNKEQFYKKLVDSFHKDHPNMLERSIELARLQRSKTVYENLYNYLVEKGEEAKIKSATSTGGILIIENPIVPIDPVPFNRITHLVLGGLLGLFLGLGLAVFQESLDKSIRSQEDIAQFLDIPIMGIIPAIKSQNGALAAFDNMRKKKNRDHFSNPGTHIPQLISSEWPQDPVFESYRSLRTNLHFCSVDHPIHSLVVTSSAPGEGKTTTSANLAIAFAELGKKTLILDADLRKPKQHKLFQIQQKPGLSDYLANDIPYERILVQTKVKNLFLIPSGTIPPNPAEMIASQKMKDLLNDLEEIFNFILIDSPPVLAATDPVLLSSKITNALLVIKFAYTDRALAREALDRIRNAHARVLGVVLNNTQYKKGYGQYKYYHN